MSERQERLIDMARRKYGRILPCGKRSDLAECFTSERDRLLLWYNTPDGSTHVEMLTNGDR